MPKKILQKVQSNKMRFYTKSLAGGLVASIVLLFAFSFALRGPSSGEVLLHQALPHYGFAARLNNLHSTQILAAQAEPAAAVVPALPVVTSQVVDSPMSQTSPPLVVGLNDVIIEENTTNYDDVQTVLNTRVLTPPNLEDLRNPERLRNTMYIVDPRTIFVPEMFDVDRFMTTDMRVNPSSLAAGDPVVLIFHTHSTEMFVDSNPSDKYTGIVGVGAYLANLLNNMGIGTIHKTQRFDMIDGRSHILGAYERQVPYIRRILEENPTIEIVIDLHRDGLPNGAPRLVTNINGEQTAQIMFFNGLSLRNEGGRPTPIATLPNPYLQYNLAFSFQMQLAANQMFDNFTRRIYLNAFRYSLHFKPKSLLVEVGAQTNTFREATNAMYPLAEILASVIR